MTQKQEKYFIEKYLRPMVRKSLKENKDIISLKEVYDEDGMIFDKLQDNLWTSLEKYVNTWSQNATKRLKSYASKNTDIDEDALIDEFYGQFEAYNMWDEMTKKHR